MCSFKPVLQLSVTACSSALLSVLIPDLTPCHFLFQRLQMCISLSLRLQRCWRSNMHGVSALLGPLQPLMLAGANVCVTDLRTLCRRQHHHRRHHPREQRRLSCGIQRRRNERRLLFFSRKDKHENVGSTCGAGSLSLLRQAGSGKKKKSCVSL